MRSQFYEKLTIPTRGGAGACLVVLAALMLLTGCSPVNMQIAHGPRGCTEATSRPPALPGYHTGWDAEPWKGTSSGYDMMLHFAPQEQKVNHFLVQEVAVHHNWRDWNPLSGGCDLADSEDFDIEEVMRAEGNDVQRWFHPQSQSVMTLTAVGDVGYVEPPAGRSFPTIAKTENVAFLNIQDGGGGPIWTATLTPAELQDLTDRRNKATLTHYEYQYEYDGCSRPKPNTNCGARHCLKIKWWDVKGGNRSSPVSTKSFSGSGTPKCPPLDP